MATAALSQTKGISLDNNKINLNWAERYLSVVAGVNIGLSGIKRIFRNPFSSMLKIGAGGYLLNRGITGHCELYSRMGKLSTDPVNIKIHSSFIINKPRQEIYDFWRKPDNLPLFMNHLERVDQIDDKHSHWVMKVPTGVTTLSWDAEIVCDIPNELIGWSSLPGSVIDNAGKVRFKDAMDGKGTVVDIIISYQPPAGGIGAGLAHVLNPVFKNMVDADIQNFKQYMDIESIEMPAVIV